MKKRVFHISKKDSCYQEASFTVPPLWNRLSFSLEMPEQAARLCYLLVFDSHGRLRFHHQVGYGDWKYQLGIDGMSTSLGGIPGEIEPGEWKAAICCFSEYIDQYLGDAEFDIVIRLSDKYIMVEEPVGEKLWCRGDYDFEQIFQQKEGWFCGDFHTHTRLSDGKETVRCAMKKAAKMGMDFYVPTEHNVVHTGWPETDIMILPGVEITTCLGHFNIFGCISAPSQLLDIMKEAGEEDIWKKMKYTIRECEKNGWLWSINHPFLHIWKWLYYDLPLKNLHLMEIVNDPTYGYAPEANDEAVSFLDYLWKHGYVVYGLGGSDSHNLESERYEGATEPSIPGDPATLVYMNGLSPDHLMQGVAAGHVIICRYVRAEVSFYYHGRQYLPGDRIETGNAAEDPLYCKGTVTNLPEEAELFLVDSHGNRKMPWSTKSGKIGEIDLEIPWGQGDWQWTRLEIRDPEGKFLAYINPVYRGEHRSGCKTFGEAVKGWQKHREKKV